MGASQVAAVVKNPLTYAGDGRGAVRKIAWRRAWQPTLMFLPGKSLPESLELQRVGHNLATQQHTPMQNKKFFFFFFFLNEWNSGGP